MAAGLRIKIYKIKKQNNKRRLRSKMIEHIYTAETAKQKDIYLEIPYGDIAWFLCWFEKTRNHYHMKSYLQKFINRIEKEEITRKMKIDKMILKIILRHRDDH